MRQQAIARLFILGVALAALGLGLGGVAAWADEPPPKDFPPPAASEEEPAPPPKAPEAKLPPAEVPSAEKPQPPAPKKPAAKAPAEDTSWSPPAVTPGATGSALPPPQIIRRRGSASGVRTRQPTVTSTPIVDVPTARPMLRPTRPSGVSTRGLPPRPPAPGFTPQLPSGPSTTTTGAAPQAPRAYPTVASTSRVFGIAKTHNVPLATKDLALQMEVDYEVGGQDGRDVYVGIWFVRTDTGKHVRAAMTTYRDPGGFLTLQTRTARVRGSAGRFTATLRIPYRAFPVAKANDSYEVEARVQILRADGSGRATSLAKGSTTFRVYGYTEEPADSPVEATGTP